MQSSRISTLLAALGLVAFGAMGPALAQDAPAGDAPASDAPAEAPAETTGEDAPADDANAVGKPYVKDETHGDWQLRCLRAPLGQSDPCQMFQFLNDENDNTVAEVNITPVANNKEVVASMSVDTPIGTLLPPGIKVSIDGREAGRMPFLFCTPRECQAEVPLKAADLQALKDGNAAKLVIVPATAPDQNVELTVSLKGFTAGYNAVSAPAE